MSLNYIGNLIDKAKRYISGYLNSTITVTIFYMMTSVIMNGIDL